MREELYLLTNSMDEPANLSFERLFGKAHYVAGHDS